MVAERQRHSDALGGAPRQLTAQHHRLAALAASSIPGGGSQSTVLPL